MRIFSAVSSFVSEVVRTVRRMCVATMASIRYHRRHCLFEERLADFAGVPVYRDDDFLVSHIGVKNCPYAAVVMDNTGVPVIVVTREFLRLPALIQVFALNHEYGHVCQIRKGQIDLTQEKAGRMVDRVDLEIDADGSVARHFAINPDQRATLLMLLFDATLGGIDTLYQTYTLDVIEGRHWCYAEFVLEAANRATGYNASMRQRIAACVEAKQAIMVNTPVEGELQEELQN